MADDAGMRPPPSTLTMVGYRAKLYGAMAKLKFDIALIQYKITNAKKLMGVAIFDRMQDGDHSGAEDVFMNCKRTVDELLRTLHLKMDEYDTLRADGESDTLKKPT